MSLRPGFVALEDVGDMAPPGTPLPFRIFDAQGRLLLAQGQQILDVEQLQSLLERGACVTLEEAKLEREKAAAQAGGGRMVLSTRRLTWFDRWERHIWDIDAALRLLGRDPAAGRGLANLADAQIALVQSQPDAMLFSLVRQIDKRTALYALTHARYAAGVAQLTAGVLGWPPERVRLAVRVALSMNSAIVELQARMAEQSEPMTRKQTEELRAHPMQSAAMLRTSGVADADWLRAVEQHHEQMGGAGYPQGLKEVDEVARVVRAADVYTAKLTPRAFRAAMSPQLAARQLFQAEQGGPIAAALIKAVGIYPPGNAVKLKNGDAGVVAQRAGANGAPVVAAIVSAAGKPLAGAPKRDTSMPEFGIAAPMPDTVKLPRILPEQIYGLLYAD